MTTTHKISRNRLAWFFILPLALSLLVTNGVVAAEQERDDIQKMMKPSEFKGAGLDKLTPAELEKLNDWLKGYRETTVAKEEQKATKEGRRKINLVVSRI